jgi:CheY-like chemotaxis protein
VLFFENDPQVIQYLGSTSQQAFLILCDVNLPLMTGIELRHYIDNSEELKKKAIPFVYFTTSSNPALVRKAYKGTIQGYFIKPESYTDLKERLSSIVSYWKSSLHPNTYG